MEKTNPSSAKAPGKVLALVPFCNCSFLGMESGWCGVPSCGLGLGGVFCGIWVVLNEFSTGVFQGKCGYFNITKN